MTTTTHSGLARGEAVRLVEAAAAARAVRRLWLALLRWRAAERQKRRLYGIEPRLLRDMGIDPAEVYDGFRGRPGEVHGDRFRGLDFPYRLTLGR